ncbi:cytochrome c oxidase subunit II [Leptolyngbya sp. CCNP1308]|uniref:cytochrome c oxidase subunit II n=1 Tax=Leptolyngbya sp. CCNP1308 TaxID=3110255 RepID=UPI002B1F343E|nr:cytochrome c oxidase subunit II [Leptolyngbya sp. CCNP1308]MEA5448710.1 cytochrome c oxidase subunit II [Leptolyngbya sp. CCNP1308]
MNIRVLLRLAALTGIMAPISIWIGQLSYSWMPEPASAEALLVDNLFSFLTTLGTFIFLGVAGTLLYSVLFQRADKYDEGDGPPIEGNLTLEIVWTAIPLVLVIWIAGYSYKIYDEMGILGPMEHMHRGEAIAAPLTAQTSTEPEPIEVHARQWVWEFYYPEAGVASTELHLPNNTRAKLALTSEDVLHGFFVPAFRVKQDVIPGRSIDFEFTPIREGVYRLRDSQYSGTYFAAMQANVVVESPEAYQQWLRDTAALPPQPGLNPSYTEYKVKVENRENRPGWKTVTPAPAPLVNFPGSPEIPVPKP